MNIERLQIEGGFLAGLDIKFTPGLNVLIGARGTGKTSVIELIRFGLAAHSHTPEAKERSAEHAKAVLTDGSVTIGLGNVLETLTVSRDSDETRPRSNGDYEEPLVFSQTEIENLGLSEGGRLRLIDNFITGSAELNTREAAAISNIRSIFKEIVTAEADRAKIAQGLENLPSIHNQIIELENQAIRYTEKSKELEYKQKILSDITSSISSCTVRSGILDRFNDTLQKWSDSLVLLLESDLGTEKWDPCDGGDPLIGIRNEYDGLISTAAVLTQRFRALSQRTLANRDALLRERLNFESHARQVRTEIEHSVAGAGTISRQLANAQTEAARLSSLQKVVEERDNRLRQLHQRRDQAIEALNRVRSERFERRQAVAKKLSLALSPQIRVTVERYSQFAEYSKALTEALRGSGMRYTDLVHALTGSISPQELIRFIDSNDFVSLSDIAAIPKDRAARLLGHLRDNGAAEVAVASIDDNVRMSLLDGVDYKNIENLSAGQRCTVILSIILQHTYRTLIIDQPEDHLDNAYIATTVIKAIRNRKSHGQVIISTHNANIPVLGEANLIVEMTSDGRNGYVQVCGQLTDQKAVEAISNVMEGGHKAFSDRASFYKSHEL